MASNVYLFYLIILSHVFASNAEFCYFCELSENCTFTGNIEVDCPDGCMNFTAFHKDSGEQHYGRSCISDSKYEPCLPLRFILFLQGYRQFKCHTCYEDFCNISNNLSANFTLTSIVILSILYKNIIHLF